MIELGWYQGEPVKNILVRNKSGTFTEYLPVKHGRWALDADHLEYCSCCGSYMPYDTILCEDCPTNFCPSCGAKMDREDDNG